MNSWVDGTAHASSSLRGEVKGHRRGQIMIMFAFGFVALVGFAALAADMGMILMTRRSYQKIADTCAVVGAQATLASARATSCAVTNNVSTGVTVNKPPSTGLYQGDDEFVEVIINRNVQTMFMRALGMQTVPIEVRAVAHNRRTYDFGVMGLQPGVEAVKSAGGSSSNIIGNACSAGDFKVSGNLNINGYAIANGTLSGSPTSYGIESGPGSYLCADPAYPLPSPLPVAQSLPIPGSPLSISGALCVSPITIAPPASARIRIQCPSNVTVQVSGPRIDVDIQGSNHAAVQFMPSALNPSNATFQSVSIQGDGPVSLAPGWYDTIRSTSGPDITLQAGLYLINSSYDQSGSGSLTGTNVSIISGRQFEATGSGPVTLSCCASTMSNNVLIYHYGNTIPGSPWTVGSDPNAVNLMGNNSTRTITGNIYSPLTAPCNTPCVQIGGNAATMTINGQVAAPVVEMNGTGLQLTFTGAGTQLGDSYLAE
jgi:Putative Flp pilus-assembly TadE/G-like